MKKGLLLLMVFLSFSVIAAPTKKKASETVLVPEFDFQPKMVELRLNKDKVVNNTVVGNFLITNKSTNEASIVVEFLPTNFNTDGGGVNTKLTKAKKEDSRWSLVPYIVSSKDPITLKPKESKEYSFVVKNVDKIVGTKFAHFKVIQVPTVPKNLVEMLPQDVKKAGTAFKLYIQGAVIFEVKESGKTEVVVNAKYSTKYKKILFSMKNTGDHYLPFVNIVAFLTDENKKIIEKLKVRSMNDLSLVKDVTKYFISDRLEKEFKNGKNKIMVQMYADNGKISQSFIFDDLDLVTEFKVK